MNPYHSNNKRFRDVKFGNNGKEKALKKLHNLVSLEIFLQFSVRLISSPFKGLFVKRSIIVFQKVLLSVTLFISRLL